MSTYRILNPPPAPEKLPLPPGKLNIRHRQMRGVWQAFAGRTYLTGASGEFPAQAAQELATQYDVPTGSKATVHCGKNTTTIEIPQPEEQP